MDDAGLNLVQELLRPGVLGTTRPVTLRTTHGSWVFLSDDDVWKVKRPVDLGFLDFCSVERRRYFCEEEVRLNRRLAPDVYLGVVPLRRAKHGISLDGEGAIVDWAVHMRRLPDEASAAARLWSDTLDADTLATLATRLASFHGSARQTPSAGVPASLRANVDENFTQTERFIGDLVDRESFDEVRAFQLGWLATNKERLARRVAEGRIREGHGDLRLEHVYFLPDRDGVVRPVVIDCVEFNERFRCGDVAADVAFLVMELEAERRPDLAAGFLARFAEETFDFGIYEVVDFYVSYRAWVRGKVAALVATEPTVSSEIRKLKADEARRDFGLARACAGRAADGPFVVAVGGLPGSGKSTLAAALGRELAAPVVSSDRVRKMCAGLALTERGGATLYTDSSKDRIYADVLRGAFEVAQAERGVILDATFSSKKWRAAAVDFARTAGVELVFVEATCADRAVLRQRLATRRGGASISDATDEHLDDLARRYERPDEAEGLHLVPVDTDLCQEKTLAMSLEALRRFGVLPARDRRAS